MVFYSYTPSEMYMWQMEVYNFCVFKNKDKNLLMWS